MALTLMYLCTPFFEIESDQSCSLPAKDLSLPRTMVTRLAKGVLPPNTQIQKDAILAMSKGATVFVNYLSNAANEHTMKDNRRTVSPQNVLQALRDLEFEAFLPRVEAELAKFNEIQTVKRNDYRKKNKEKEGPVAGTKESGAEDSRMSTGQEIEELLELPPKRMKRDSGPMSDRYEPKDPTPQFHGENLVSGLTGAEHSKMTGMQDDEVDLEDTGDVEDGGREEDAEEEEAEDEESVSEQDTDAGNSEGDPDAGEEALSDADSEMLRRGQLDDGGGSGSASESD